MTATEIISQAIADATDHIRSARQMRRFGHVNTAEYRYHADQARRLRERAVSLGVVYLGR